jgi:hypothetical protein
MLDDPSSVDGPWSKDESTHVSSSSYDLNSSKQSPEGWSLHFREKRVGALVARGQARGYFQDQVRTAMDSFGNTPITRKRYEHGTHIPAIFLGAG